MIASLYLYCFAPTILALIVLALWAAVRCPARNKKSGLIVSWLQTFGPRPPEWEPGARGDDLWFVGSLE